MQICLQGDMVGTLFHPSPQLTTDPAPPCTILVPSHFLLPCSPAALLLCSRAPLLPQSLQIAAFLFTVCHVVIVVQDWFTDLSLYR